jgi:CheY-like chemotaxis protein
MSFKPVILIYDLDNKLVDEIAAELGMTGLYTSISTYNEANAMDAIHQYDRGFGYLTNKISCVITGWNNHKRPRDQFLYHLRTIERKSPLRQQTPVIIVTEDHREDLKRRALEPSDGAACAYLHKDNFRDTLTDIMHRVVFQKLGAEVNRQSLEELLQSLENTD